MSHRPDDTAETDAPTPAHEPERAPHSYYYDDGTGYATYDPAAEDEEDEEAEADKEAARRRPTA